MNITNSHTSWLTSCRNDDDAKDDDFGKFKI